MSKSGKSSMRGYPPNVKVDRDKSNKPKFHLPTIVIIERIAELERAQTRPEPEFIQYAFTDTGLEDTLREARTWLENSADIEMEDANSDFVIMIHKPIDVYTVTTTSELTKYNVKIQPDDKAIN